MKQECQGRRMKFKRENKLEIGHEDICVYFSQYENFNQKSKVVCTVLDNDRN